MAEVIMGNIVHRRHRERGFAAALAMTAVLAAGTLAGVAPASAATTISTDATLAQGGTISGVLTQKVAGVVTPASEIAIFAHSGDGQNYIAQSYPDHDGNYTLTGLAAGSYVLEFRPFGSSLAEEFWDNSTSFVGATRIVVGSASSVSNINAELEPGATITGTVTKTVGGATVPANGVYVYAQGTAVSQSAWAETDASGRYTLLGLNPGDYKLSFDPHDAAVVSKWYKNSTTRESGDTIAVAARSTVPDINVNLEKASTITGQVTKSIDGSVSNASGITVSLYNAKGEYVRKVGTAPDGKYSVGSLMAGTYKVGFEQYDTSAGIAKLASEFYDNVPDISSAKSITVGSAAVVGGINAQLNLVSADPNPDPDPTTPPIPVDRAAGPDRFSTSAAISAMSFSPGVSVAYIANGGNFPDALSAAPVAGNDDAPVLLVETGRVPTAVETELKRLKPARIVVLGGVGAISNTVQTALKQFTTGSVDRLSGADRFATSAAISAAAFEPGVAVTYIANGDNFPDALSAAPVAGKDQAPVLLVPANSVPATIQAELSRLHPGRIVVIGGVGAVSDTVQVALKEFTDGTVTRLSGVDRFATSAAISKASFQAGAPVVYVANGNDFPDALSGAPVAGMKGAPLLLLSAGSIPAVIHNELVRLKPGRIVVLGGVGVVSAAVAEQLVAYTGN